MGGWGVGGEVKDPIGKSKILFSFVELLNKCTHT